MEENLPVFLRERLLKEYKKDIVEKIILGYMQKRKVTLRVNTIKIISKIIAKIIKERPIISGFV